MLSHCSYHFTSDNLFPLPNNPMKWVLLFVFMLHIKEPRPRELQKHMYDHAQLFMTEPGSESRQCDSRAHSSTLSHAGVGCQSPTPAIPPSSLARILFLPNTPLLSTAKAAHTVPFTWNAVPIISAICHLRDPPTTQFRQDSGHMPAPRSPPRARSHA